MGLQRCRGGDARVVRSFLRADPKLGPRAAARHRPPRLQDSGAAALERPVRSAGQPAGRSSHGEDGHSSSRGRDRKKRPPRRRGDWHHAPRLRAGGRLAPHALRSAPPARRSPRRAGVPRSRHSWPATLAEAGEPLADPFNGKPLRYIPRPNGFLLYSIGKDGVDGKGGRRRGVRVPSEVRRAGNGKRETGNRTGTRVPDPRRAVETVARGRPDPG